MRRIALAIAMACGMLAITPAIASAHTGTVAMTCSSVTYTFDDASFAYGGTTFVQTILETVSIGGTKTAQTTVQINPLDGSTTVSSLPISVPAGSHTVVADAFDQTTGAEVQIVVLANGQTSTNGYFPVTQTVQGCAGALTPGFWKNHEAATSALLPQSLGGFAVTTFSDAHAVFVAMNCGNSSSQNAFGCLAGHLLAAELNVANGAAEPGCASSAISEANSLLSGDGYVGPTGTYALSAADRATAVSLAGSLSNYNNGSPTC
jgi:hypothetical protein